MNRSKWTKICCAAAIALLAATCWKNRRWFICNDVTSGESTLYPEIQSRLYHCNMEDTMRATERTISELRDWKITRTHERANVVDAEVSVAFGRFTDDVSVYCQPVSARLTRVIVRSHARLGKGDLGVNAGHIRQLQRAMDARLINHGAI